MSWNNVAVTAVTTILLVSCTAQNDRDPSTTDSDTAREEAIADGATIVADEVSVDVIARTNDVVTDDITYLAQLNFVRGHLFAFNELFRAGEYDAAQTHAKHPESELYQGLEPAFSARGKSGFAAELQALTSTAAARGDVETAYATTLDAIRANAPETTIAKLLMAVSEVTIEAADEFDLGVGAEGVIVNAHEYQDAFGFLAASRELLSETFTSDINESEAISVAHEQLDLALSQFDGLVVTSTQGDALTIRDAGERIAKVASRL